MFRGKQRLSVCLVYTQQNHRYLHIYRSVPPQTTDPPLSISIQDLHLTSMSAATFTALPHIQVKPRGDL